VFRRDLVAQAWSNTIQLRKKKGEYDQVVAVLTAVADYGNIEASKSMRCRATPCVTRGEVKPNYVRHT
jgi:hypothetical protein